MTFKDTEVLEALLPNNLLEIDPLGYLVTPPDVYSNNLRIFIPRTALTEMEVLGVISDGVVRRMSQRAAQARVTRYRGDPRLVYFSRQLLPKRNRLETQAVPGACCGDSRDSGGTVACHGAVSEAER